MAWLGWVERDGGGPTTEWERVAGDERLTEWDGLLLERRKRRPKELAE